MVDPADTAIMQPQRAFQVELIYVFRTKVARGQRVHRDMHAQCSECSTSPCIYCTWGESERPWVREPDSAILTHLLFPYILDRSTYMQILKNKCYGTTQSTDFPGGSDGKESTFSAGDPGLIPASGRASGEGNSNPLQYSCLENSMD